MTIRRNYLRALPSELPKSPDISHLLRADMISHMPSSMPAADKRHKVDQMLTWAAAEGDGIRRRQRQQKIDKLRAEVKSLARQGRYPRHLWAKLQDYERAQAADRSGS